MGADLKPMHRNNLRPLSVLLIGCGNIAGGFDKGREPNYLPYTHAGAYARDGRFEITACVEPDDERRKEFMSTWNILIGFHAVEEVLNGDYQFDVISICSPTACHSHDIEKAILLKPKLIFCEKPFTASAAASARLAAECKKANILLVVNHTRRWDPDVVKLQADMQSGHWGQLRSVVGFYNKGILNNGSHMVDLLHLLVGPLAIVKVGSAIQDYSPDDPTVPVWLRGAEDLPIHLTCGCAGDYTIFELQFVFSQGMLIMEEGGLFWRERRVVDSETFKGYRVLNEGVRRVGEYPRAMLGAIDNIYCRLKNGEPLASTGETALAAQRLCEQIKVSSLVSEI